MSRFLRAACAWLLLAAETILTWPVFVVSWMVSAIYLAARGGFQFANLSDEEQKRATLRRMMGEKVSR